MNWCSSTRCCVFCQQLPDTCYFTFIVIHPYNHHLLIPLYKQEIFFFNGMIILKPFKHNLFERRPQTYLGLSGSKFHFLSAIKLSLITATFQRRTTHYLCKGPFSKQNCQLSMRMVLTLTRIIRKTNSPGVGIPKV